MPEQLSGPQLFLRYAFPCVQDLLDTKKIDHVDFEELELLIKNSDEPDIIFLAICFSNAVRMLRRFSKYLDIEMWSLETVTEFWRNNHNHIGDCAVTKANVCSMTSDNLVARIIAGNRSFGVVNTYKLDLKIGDDVYLHKRSVIEKME